MKTVCRVLGVARSHIAALTIRSAAWTDRRKARTNDAEADAALVDAVRTKLASSLPIAIGVLGPWSTVAVWRQEWHRLITSASTA